MYIIIFAFLCSIGNYSIEYSLGKKLENQSPYYLSFASIGANSLESRMDCWAKIKTVSSLEELDQNMIKILNSLNLPVDTKKLIHTSDKQEIILRYEIENGNEAYNLILKSNWKLKETYYILSFLSSQKNNQFYEYAQTLNDTPGVKWNIYFLYTGTINNIIEYESQEEIVNVVLKKLEAKKIETYKNGKITSATAYSNVIEKINPYIRIEGKKYNIQVAVRINEKEKKTYVYIGTPLILGNY